MTPRVTIPLAVIAFSLACNADNGVTPSNQDELVGTWISAGSDVSIGLTSTARAAKVKATFNANATYTIEITDSASHVEFHAGEWSASAGRGETRSITLVQASPSATVEQGVFLVNGARLTYEVIPVQPAAEGNVPATVASGFGTATQNGDARESTWIQRFWSAEMDMVTPPCNPNDSLSAVAKRPCDGHQWTAETQKRSQH